MQRLWFTCDRVNKSRVYEKKHLKHLRGNVPDDSVLKAKATLKMKAFITEQYSSDIPPRHAWSHLRDEDEFKSALFGLPTQSQVGDLIKTHTSENGASIQVVKTQDFIDERTYHPGLDAYEPFFFGYKTISEGKIHVGDGENNDRVLLGITSKYLLTRATEFASASQFAPLHTDTTSKLSEVESPVIACGFSRAYHLTALFIVSRRTTVESSIVFAMLLDVVAKVCQQSIRIDTITGDAEDAQLDPSLTTKRGKELTALKSLHSSHRFG